MTTLASSGETTSRSEQARSHTLIFKGPILPTEFADKAVKHTVVIDGAYIFVSRVETCARRDEFEGSVGEGYKWISFQNAEVALRAVTKLGNLCMTHEEWCIDVQQEHWEKNPYYNQINKCDELIDLIRKNMDNQACQVQTLRCRITDLELERKKLQDRSKEWLPLPLRRIHDLEDYMKIYCSQTTVDSTTQVIENLRASSPLFVDPLRTWSIVMFGKHIVGLSKDVQQFEEQYPEAILKERYGKENEVWYDVGIMPSLKAARVDLHGDPNNNLHYMVEQTIKV